MTQRNLRSTNQMMNLEPDQRPRHPQPQPNPNHVLAVVEPMTSFAPHPQPGVSDNSIPYGMAQYNAAQNHLIAATPVMGLATSSNYYNHPYATQPGSSMFPQGPQFYDGFGAAFKRKSAEGYYGSFQYGSSGAGSSSAGPSRAAPIGGEAMLAQNPTHLIPVQALVPVPVGAPWVGQQFNGNGGDGSLLAWGQAGMPYMQGNGVNSGFTGMANMVPEANFQPHPPLIYAQSHPQPLHHLPQPVQGSFYPQVPSTSYGPQVPSTSYGYPRNNGVHGNVNTFQVGSEVGPAYVGLMTPGVAVYHPSSSHGRQVLPGATQRRHQLPRFNLLPAEEVAMLQVPGHYEMGNAVDHHRDMRMDVDSMSYEELLALEEHIGTVTVGLSEEAILKNLKVRTYFAPPDFVELDDQETDFCTVCQMNYEDAEKIGTLDCGHEYHVECIKDWLVIKNLCPICKQTGLTIQRDSTHQG